MTINPRNINASAITADTLEHCERNNLDKALDVIYGNFIQKDLDQLTAYWSTPALSKSINEPDLFYQHRICSLTMLFAIRAYLKYNVGPVYYETQNLTILEDCVQRVISISMPNDDSSFNRLCDTEVDALQKAYFKMDWFNNHNNMFFYLQQSLMVRPFLINTCNQYNITILEQVGSGSFGCVFQIIHDKKDYAMKCFENHAFCRKEELIMQQLQKLPNASIAHLQMNDIINCCTHNCFVTDFLYAFPLNKIPFKFFRDYPGGLFKFVHDIKQDIQQNVFDLMNQPETGNIKVYHMDLTSNNLMYSPILQQFFVIDWGLAHDFTRRELWCDDQWYGSMETFGPSGWALMSLIDKEPEMVSIAEKEDELLYWSLAHSNDLYALSAVQMEVLGIYSELFVFRSFTELCHETANKINKDIHYRYWKSRNFHKMHTLWEKRAALISKNHKTSRPLNLSARPQPFSAYHLLSDLNEVLSGYDIHFFDFLDEVHNGSRKNCTELL